jgi:hypothetical protein
MGTDANHSTLARWERNCSWGEFKIRAISYAKAQHAINFLKIANNIFAVLLLTMALLSGSWRI